MKTLILKKIATYSFFIKNDNIQVYVKNFGFVSFDKDQNCYTRKVNESSGTDLFESLSYIKSFIF